MSSNIIHVSSRKPKGWEIKREGASRASRILDTKKEAVEAAEEYISQKDDVDVLIIHKGNGEIQFYRTYDKESESVRNLKDEEMIDKKYYGTGKFDIAYYVWKSEYKGPEITEEHIGKKIKLASDSSVTAYLQKIHQPGDKYFPDGGYTIKAVDRGTEQFSDHFLGEIALHESARWLM